MFTMPHSETAFAAPAPLAMELEQKFFIAYTLLWEESTRLLEDAAPFLTELQHSLYKKLLAEISHYVTFRKMHFYPFLAMHFSAGSVQPHLSVKQAEELDSYLKDVCLQHQRLRDYFYRCAQIAKPLYENESASYMLLRSRLLELKKLSDEWIFLEEAQLLPQLFSLK